MKKSILHSAVFLILFQALTSVASAVEVTDDIREMYNIKTVEGLPYSADFIRDEPQQLGSILKSTFRYGQCSGTFVSKYGHVLTALHCIENLMNSEGSPKWGRVRNPQPPYQESQGYMILAKAFQPIDTIMMTVNDWLRADFGKKKTPMLGMKIIFKGAAVPDQFPSYLEDEKRFFLTDEETELGKRLNQDFAIIQIETPSLHRPWKCAKVRRDAQEAGSTVYSSGYPNQWGRIPDVGYIPVVTQGILEHTEYALPQRSDLINIEPILPDNGMYYTTAATAQGMSGGGLYNNNAELVAVTSAGQGKIFSKRSYQVRTDFIMNTIRLQKPESFLKFVFDCP